MLIRLAITEANSTLTHTLGRSPTVTDIATHLGLTEEEILNEVVRLYGARKLCPQYVPRFGTLSPRFDFLDMYAIHRQKEGRRKVSPEGFAIEIGEMKGIPRGTHLMTGE